jgi:SRSO17 transposase
VIRRRNTSPPAQRLRFYLSESSWDIGAVNAWRQVLFLADPSTALHEGGALGIDETGDSKDGTRTGQVGRQYLGSIGKIDYAPALVLAGAVLSHSHQGQVTMAMSSTTTSQVELDLILLVVVQTPFDGARPLLRLIR